MTAFTPDPLDDRYHGVGYRHCVSCDRTFRGAHRDEMCSDCWAKFNRRPNAI